MNHTAGILEKQDPEPWEDPEPKTLRRFMTQDPMRTQDSMRIQDTRRIQDARRTQGLTRIQDPMRTCIIPPIKYSIWLKNSKILYFIQNFWGVKLVFPKIGILYLLTTSITRSFHISNSWQCEWQTTTFMS